MLRRHLALTLRRSDGIIALLCCLIVFCYSFWVLVLPYNSEKEKIISSFILIFLCVAFAIFGLRLAAQKDTNAQLRRAWLFLSLANLAWAAGECFWFYYESVLHVSPVPSAADLCFVLYWALLFLGVASFPFSATRKQERRILWLDLAIVMSTSFILLWDFVLSPMKLIGQLDWIRLITVLYPVSAMLVFAAMVAMMQRDVERIERRVLLILASGMLCSIFANIMYAYFEVNQIPYSVVYLNILWMISLMFMILAAALHRSLAAENFTTDLPFTSSRLLLRKALPYLAIIIGIILLLLRMTSPNISVFRLYGVVFGTAVLVVLGFLRQHALLRENVQLYEEMQRLAITDGLTGIYNRHFINQVLPSEMARAKRYSYDLAVLLIDINGFKTYNDTFGHLQGDVALKKVAALLQSQLRSTDILGRFGGDEFVAIIHEADREGASIVAMKMKETVSNGSSGNGILSVSIGVGIYRPEMTPEELLEEADQELYRGKAALRTAG